MRFTIIKIILLLIFAFNEKAYSKKFDLEALKEACSSIGFKIKTEKHGECVLELHKRSDELKLYKVVTKEQSSEPQKTKSKQATTSTEYSSYFEAKNECTKKSMTVSSNYNKWICYSPNESNYTQVDKKHCSELYGCAPEKYDQEIEAEARAPEQKMKRDELIKKSQAYNNYISTEGFISYREWEQKKTNNFKSTNQQDTNYSNSFVDQARVNKNINSSYSGEGLGDFIEDLLTIGIVIGGAYLLGTALTPATPPPVGTTTNVFTTIIQEAPRYGSPLGY